MYPSLTYPKQAILPSPAKTDIPSPGAGPDIFLFKGPSANSQARGHSKRSNSAGGQQGVGK